MSSTSASRSRGSNSGSQASVTVPTTVPLASDETCYTTSFVPQGYPSFCRATRSCRSCLEKTDCMVSTDGRCMSPYQSGYSPQGWMNYRNAYSYDLVLPNATTTNPTGLESSQHWLFPSGDATYCPTDDAVCQRCIAAQFWMNGSWPDSRFCVGENGCVCIFDCEDTRNVPAVDCTTYSTTPSPSATTDVVDFSNLNATIKAVAIGLAGVLVLVAVLLYYCVRRDYLQRRRQDALRQSEREARATLRAQQRQQRMEQRGLSMLSLSGWKMHRQSLIAKETQHLAQGVTSESEAMSSTPYALAVDEETLHAPLSRQTGTHAPTGEARSMFMPSA